MSAQMEELLKSINTIMQSVNASMNPAEMNNIMKQFAMETEKMGM